MNNKELYNEIKYRRIIPGSCQIKNLYITKNISKDIEGVEYTNGDFVYKIMKGCIHCSLDLGFPPAYYINIKEIKKI